MPKRVILTLMNQKVNKLFIDDIKRIIKRRTKMFPTIPSYEN